ncbi:MAG TPA: hypothetical protein VN045_10755 [Microbacteriaceae bacterium]|nr:hypothetical protein [Microbacteriaceae bacterium]
MDLVWGEYIPNWIAAVSTALALLAAGVAAYFAWRALRAENEREARRNAVGLSAWWVKGDVDGEEVWGIMICNDAVAVFHDIMIQAVGNSHKKAGRTIDFRTLPPGHFFVQSMPYTSDRPWGPKISLKDDAAFVPLTDADSRRVEAIHFTDTAARSWTWSHSNGLTAR